MATENSSFGSSYEYRRVGCGVWQRESTSFGCCAGVSDSRWPCVQGLRERGWAAEELLVLRGGRATEAEAKAGPIIPARTISSRMIWSCSACFGRDERQQIDGYYHTWCVSSYERLVTSLKTTSIPIPNTWCTVHAYLVRVLVHLIHLRQQALLTRGSSMDRCVARGERF